MKKILLLLVLGSVCALDVFAAMQPNKEDVLMEDVLLIMKQKKVADGEDGFFVKRYKSIITPKGEDDPLVDVIMSSSLDTRNKIREVGKQLFELDSNRDQRLGDIQFTNKLISDLEALIKSVGPTTITTTKITTTTTPTVKWVRKEWSAHDKFLIRDNGWNPAPMRMQVAGDPIVTTIETPVVTPIPAKVELVKGINDLIDLLNYFIDRHSKFNAF